MPRLRAKKILAKPKSGRYGRRGHGDEQVEKEAKVVGKLEWPCI